jgi:hypothetical protein
MSSLANVSTLLQRPESEHGITPNHYKRSVKIKRTVEIRNLHTIQATPFLNALSALRIFKEQLNSLGIKSLSSPPPKLLPSLIMQLHDEYEKVKISVYTFKCDDGEVRIKTNVGLFNALHKHYLSTFEGTTVNELTDLLRAKQDVWFEFHTPGSK